MSRDGRSINGTVQELRKLIENALSKNLHESAQFIAEKLTMLTSANDSDFLLYAQCYFKSGEVRRSLSVLEHRGLLSSEKIYYLSQQIMADGNNSIDQQVTNSPTKDFFVHLDALLLAAQCLHSVEQFEDCINLLQSIVYVGEDGKLTDRYVSRLHTSFNGGHAHLDVDEHIHIMSSIYSLVGKCYDAVDNRSRAIRALSTALLIDPACTEAAVHIVSNGLLNSADKAHLFHRVAETKRRVWLLPFFRVLLLNENPSHVEQPDAQLNDPQLSNGGEKCSIGTPSAALLIRQASYSFENYSIDHAYRLVRQAFTIDPYDQNGLELYIATMAELDLRTELFYLGHELVNSSPKLAVSWYCVGAYYWCCAKFDLAHKYLQKATKVDKKFHKAWVLLGHVLASEEESEQSVSAYRTASRLLPGDHRPLVYMAKEFVRTGFVSLAVHILTGALKLCPSDHSVLNELGIVFLKLGKLDSALHYFENAVQALSEQQQQLPHGKECIDDSNTCPSDARAAATYFTFRKTCGTELFSNYATCLRKLGRYEDALFWYGKCLATKRNDAGTTAAIGFTHHLMQRFDLAVGFYHKALSIRPNYTFCADMLSRALEDIGNYPQVVVEEGKESAPYTVAGVMLDHIDTSYHQKPSNIDAAGRVSDRHKPQLYGVGDEWSKGPAFQQQHNSVISGGHQENSLLMYDSVDDDGMDGVSGAYSFSRIAERLSISVIQGDSELFR